MPMKRTPPKLPTNTVSAKMSTSKTATTVNPVSCGPSSLLCTDAVLNKSASDSDLSHITPVDFISQRKKRPREQMEESISKEFCDLREEILNLMASSFASQAGELKQVNTTLQDIKQSNLNIEKTVSFLAAQNEEFKQRIIDLETQAKRDRNYITTLEHKIEEMQIGSRKSSLEIKNVPKSTHENKEDLIQMVVELSKSVDCNISSSDIKDIYRVRPKYVDSKNSPIVVEMNSTIQKNNMLRSAKTFNIRHKSKLCAKHVGLKTQEDTPIFISEHLTPKNARLYFLARDLSKSKSFKFCWTAYGKVYVRENEHSPIILINNENQLHQLLTAQHKGPQTL